MVIHVRDAVVADVEAITRILDEAIRTSDAIWRSAPYPPGDRAVWFEAQSAAGRPVLVAVDDGVVVGFASYGQFRDNERLPGYRFTVEHSVYVDDGVLGRGVGRRLMDELIARAATDGVHVMIGAVDGGNEGSIRFHERLGFVEQGRLSEVGWNGERWLDLVFMVRRID